MADASGGCTAVSSSRCYYIMIHSLPLASVSILTRILLGLQPIVAVDTLVGKF
jgi:hypothetical protein